MENTDNDNRFRRSGGRIWIPLGLVLIGGVMFLRQLGLGLPEWLFSWQMLLIGIGIISGFTHEFRGPGWLIMILIGTFFMIDQVIPGFNIHRFLWPVIIVVVGLVMLIRPKKNDWTGNGWNDRWYRNRRRWRDRFENRWHESSAGSTPGKPSSPESGPGINTGFESKSFSSEDYISATTIFGGIHKNILSKNFKGGDLTIFMGGAELNLSQADIQGTAAIDITQIMGGTKIIIPSHWELRSQLTSVFGNIEDKRQNITNTNHDKVLIIDGTSIFGGIEIRNY